MQKTFKKGEYIALVLLFAHIERVSVSRMRDCFRIVPLKKKYLLRFPRIYLQAYLCLKFTILVFLKVCYIFLYSKVKINYYCRTQEGPAFMRPSVRPFVPQYVRLYPFGLVLSNAANIPHTPKIFTDSEPPIKLDVVGPEDNRPSTD